MVSVVILRIWLDGKLELLLSVTINKPFSNLANPLSVPTHNAPSASLCKQRMVLSGNNEFWTLYTTQVPCVYPTENENHTILNAAKKRILQKEKTWATDAMSVLINLSKVTALFQHVVGHLSTCIFGINVVGAQHSACNFFNKILLRSSRKTIQGIGSGLARNIQRIV